MDVHARHGIFYGPQNVAIVERRETVRQAALDADFGGAELPGFDGFLRDLVHSQEVCIGFARAAAEGAEFASHEANIGEVDVAVHYIGDKIAGELRAKNVGGDEHAKKVVTVTLSEGERFFAGKCGA